MKFIPVQLDSLQLSPAALLNDILYKMLVMCCERSYSSHWLGFYCTHLLIWKYLQDSKLPVTDLKTAFEGHYEHCSTCINFKDDFAECVWCFWNEVSKNLCQPPTCMEVKTTKMVFFWLINLREHDLSLYFILMMWTLFHYSWIHYSC